MRATLTTLCAALTLGGCAAPGTSGMTSMSGMSGDTAALAVARQASVQFCGEFAAGCEFRARRDGDYLVVTADRFRLTTEGTRFHRVDDSFVYVIGIDGRVVNSYWERDASRAPLR